MNFVVLSKYVQMKITKIDRLMTGIAVIRGYDPNAELSAHIDVIHFGTYSTIKDEMTTFDKLRLETYGWCVIDDRWTLFV